MLSSLMEKGGDNTLHALELGAVDFVDKSAAGGPMDISTLARELTDKIRMASPCGCGQTARESMRVKIHHGLILQRLQEAETEVVLIGTSTAGSSRLAECL